MWPLLLLAGLTPADLGLRFPSTVIPRPAAQLTAAAQAERIGRDIYDFDQAAWGATDAMAKVLPDFNGAGVKGWIVEREPAGTVATFYGQKAGGPYKMFVAHMQGQKVVFSHLLKPEEDSSLSEIERRMIAARDIALKSETLRKIDFHPCTNGSINTVVLPPATTDAAVAVYVLTPQRNLESFPIGGHYRVDIGSDGAILHSRAFTKSCIDLDRRQVPAEAKLFLVSHMLDRQPTEIHVWIALASHVPLGVLILPQRDMWSVAEGKVDYVSTLPESAFKK